MIIIRILYTSFVFLSSRSTGVIITSVSALKLFLIVYINSAQLFKQQDIIILSIIIIIMLRPRRPDRRRASSGWRKLGYCIGLFCLVYLLGVGINHTEQKRAEQRGRCVGDGGHTRFGHHHHPHSFIMIIIIIMIHLIIHLINLLVCCTAI